MATFTFTIERKKFRLQHLGRDHLGRRLNDEFVRIHWLRFSEQSPFRFGGPFDWRDHVEELSPLAHAYFDCHRGDWKAHDKLFNNFTIIWQSFLWSGDFGNSARVWELALEPAMAWEIEREPERVHKGTPYYFWGMTLLLARDFDGGFLLMHQALAEDVASLGTSSPDTPASAFAKLDYTQEQQAFKDEVRAVAQWVDTALLGYRRDTQGTLTLDELREKLLSNPGLRDTVFSFVYVLFKLESLLTHRFPAALPASVRMNDFAALLELKLIFDLCLVVDSVLRYKNPRRSKFLDLVADLSQRCGLQLTANALRALNQQARSSFDQVMRTLLSGLLPPSGSRLSPTEQGLALSYVLRNFGAHNIEATTLIYDYFDTIVGGVLNTIFLVVERLY